MSGATQPGIAFGSREFYDACLTDCPEPLRPAVERLCSRWGSDDSDPNHMAQTILSETRQAMRVTHILKDGTRVVPLLVNIGLAHVTYSGKDARGIIFAYSPDSIVGTGPLDGSAD